METGHISLESEHIQPKTGHLPLCSHLSLLSAHSFFTEHIAPTRVTPANPWLAPLDPVGVPLVGTRSQFPLWVPDFAAPGGRPFLRPALREPRQ